MSFIEEHPYVLTYVIGGIATLTGFFLTFDDPAKTLMWAGILTMGMSGFAYVGKKFS